MSATAQAGGERLRREYQFAGFTLDVPGGFLRRAGQALPLRPKAFQALVYLVQNHGRVIPKEELIGAIWPDTAVTDNSLVQCIGELRLVLGDEAQQIIRTVSRRGYIFAAQIGSPVAALAVLAPGVPIALPTSRHTRHLAAAGLAVAALLTVSVIVARNPRAPRNSNAGAAAIHALAVLPLEDLTRDGKQDYFADGMTEALISHLAARG
jgi:DNA-binding winged helix-turn-helix (wHTH) protein